MVQYYFHPTAQIEDEVLIGDYTKIWHFCHVRKGAKIGTNCNLGKDVFVDMGVTIGNNVKLQNGISVYRGVTIEDDVFLGPHMTFTNDLLPRAFNTEWNEIPTYVKKGASVGAHATIVCGTVLGEYCMIGSGSVVTKDVPDYGLVYGNPARLRGFVCKCGNRAHKVNRDGEEVVLKCEKCDEIIRISKEVYSMYEMSL
jgi:acetyltransferase-like isoleucine patch superfamily enzyme